jgi:uncharacterized protein YkwD
MLPLVSTQRPRRLWRIAAPLVVVAATTTGCFGAAGAGDAGILLRRVNEVRASAGLPALSWCGTLTNAATKHATDMEFNGVRGHIGSDGSTFQNRAAAYGYHRWTHLAENVAWGYTSVEQVLAAWLASLVHRQNILSPAMQHAGFARVGNSWVQMFGANGTC